MDPETNRCFGLLIIPRPCRSHGNHNCRFFKTVPPLLMKTVLGFILMKNLKLTAISKKTSTIMCVSILCGHEILNYLFGVILLTLLMINGIDVVGHMKLVNGQSLIEAPSLTKWR
ncbi:unnamed protein product [Brassica oleracea]